MSSLTSVVVGEGAAFVWRESDAGAYNMDATPGGGFHTIYFAEPKLEKLTVFELHAPFSSGEWHTLTVQAEGSQISFYLDGVPLGSTEVLDADAPWAGRVGLRTFSAPGDDVEEVWFDDVEVQLLGAKPTTTPAPTPIPGMPGGSVVEVSYGHMLFAGANESYREWEPAETMYNSRWNLFSTEPVSLVASFDDPLDLLGVAPRPQSVNQAEGRYSYQLSPATNFMFILQAQLAVDNGLRLSRNMTPSTLSPGTNQVVIDVSIEILRLPTISGVSVRPVGGHIDLKVGDTSLTLLRDGAESYQSKSGGVRPVRVRSVSGPTSMRLGPLLEPGQKYNLRVDAVFENPNLFPVFYVPTLDTNLDIDTDATRFKISIPSGIQTIAPNISFDAVGIVGEEVAFTFSNPSNEKVFWAITGGSMPQLHQHLEGAAASGALGGRRRSLPRTRSGRWQSKFGPPPARSVGTG